MGACSLVREEREEREERRGERGCFLCFALPVWSSGWVLVVRLAKRWGFGRGVRCGLPVCLAPAVFPVPCPSGFRPWLRCSSHVAYVGMSVSVPCSAAGHADIFTCPNSDFFYQLRHTLVAYYQSRSFSL